MSKCLQPNSVPVPITLAQKLTPLLNHLAPTAAMLVQQIHYWIGKGGGDIYEERRWIYNAFTKWKKDFSWLTDYSFRKIKRILSELGIIKAKQLGLRQHGRDRSCWYTLDYQHEFIKDSLKDSHSKSTDGTEAISTDGIVDKSTHHNNKTTPNTTSEKTTTQTAAVSEKIEFKEEPILLPSKKPAIKSEVMCDLSESTQEEISCATEKRKILHEIRDHLGISLNPQIERLVHCTTTAVVKEACAYVAELQQKGQVKNPAGYLTSAIKEQWKLSLPKEEKPFSKMPQEVNPPTVEQMVQLQSALDRGEIYDIHLSSDGVTKVIKLDKFTQVPWWAFLDLNHCASSSFLH